jgi:carboxymethylenebutenolidase
MIEKAVEIQTPDGVADGFLFQPEADGKWPGVVHLTDIGGLRAAQHQMARRLAGAGYVVLLPNIFYRITRPPVFEDYPLNFNDEKVKKQIAELRASLPPDAVARDASADVGFLARQESVTGDSFGIVGYCFSGPMALGMAAACPDQITAMASFHGGGLYTDAPESPHRVLLCVRARLYFGHAVEDRSMPQEAIERFEKALTAWGGKFESETYKGAFHGWTTPDSPAYNAAQADRAFSKLVELFGESLGQKQQSVTARS